MRTKSQTSASSAAMLNGLAAAPDKNLYVIEREIPGAGDLSRDELKAIATKSNGVLSEMGPEITWIHSFVTGDKIYCVYTAPNAEMVQEHANQGGFPANVISKVETVIDPSTAD